MDSGCSLFEFCALSEGKGISPFFVSIPGTLISLSVTSQQWVFNWEALEAKFLKSSELSYEFSKEKGPPQMRRELH